jgi:hypothetical protein
VPRQTERSPSSLSEVCPHLHKSSLSTDYRVCTDDGQWGADIFNGHAIGCNAVSWAPATIPGSLITPSSGANLQTVSHTTKPTPFNPSSALLPRVAITLFGFGGIGRTVRAGWRKKSWRVTPTGSGTWPGLQILGYPEITLQPPLRSGQGIFGIFLWISSCAHRIKP